MQGGENKPAILASPSLNPKLESHQLIIKDSAFLTSQDVADNSVHLVVTSPPYPMVRQWDELFRSKTGRLSFQDAHSYLALVWKQCHRVLVDGGILCINIGDATRTVQVEDATGVFVPIFKVFSNHSAVIEKCEKLGFHTLPYVLWKKPTTRPKYKGKTVFLGSGFLPTNAYVTMDVEYILIFRKGGPRKFQPKNKIRYDSMFTKPERDKWFSQIWTGITGARQAQAVGDSERRVAAFPEEIPRRLIQMFSVKGDVVFDPFLGTGTTIKVAADCDRRSVGVEADRSLYPVILNKTGAYDKDSPVAKQGFTLPSNVTLEFERQTK